MRVLVVHGPNLNLLGERRPELYGTLTLREVNAEIKRVLSRAGVSAVFFQSNHEGEIIDRIHAERRKVQGILINAAGLTHTSVSLRDAIEAVGLPAVEVHLTDIARREPFRWKSLLRGVCVRQFSGEGLESYLKGARHLARVLMKTQRKTKS